MGKQDKAGGKPRPDLATIAGLAIAIVGILGGLILEGGEVKDVSQITAGLIVVGGTLGAVMVSTPMSLLGQAMRSTRAVLMESGARPDAIAEQILGFASSARKNGLVALETEADRVAEPFLRKALMLAVDGTDIQELRTMMETEILQRGHQADSQAKVFESAGGYAPTIGIIGAVMGLIQVMKNLSDIDKVGHGIAVSFVATVYGVGVSNLLLLPMANKIKMRAQEDAQTCEMILEGVISIVEGLNPKLIRIKLDAYLPYVTPAKTAPAKPASSTA